MMKKNNLKEPIKVFGVRISRDNLATIIIWLLIGIPLSVWLIY